VTNSKEFHDNLTPKEYISKGIKTYESTKYAMLVLGIEPWTSNILLIWEIKIPRKMFGPRMRIVWRENEKSNKDINIITNIKIRSLEWVKYVKNALK
jgi:hypothetical protein